MPKFIYLVGTADWCQNLKEVDDKFQKYSFDLTPNEGSWEIFRKSGLGDGNLKIREKKTGEKFIKLSRAAEKRFGKEFRDMGPPNVLIRVDEAKNHGIETGIYENQEYMPYDGIIGNGSLVTAKVEIYKSNARGTTGHTLTAVLVENLVEYDPENKTVDTDLPF